MLAVASAGLVVVALAVIWLTIDMRAPSATARFYLPIAAIGVAPLLFAAHRLSRADDPIGPAVAALVSALLLVAGLGTAILLAMRTGSYTFYLVLGLFLPPFVYATIVVAVFALTLVLQLIGAIQAWRAIDRPVIRLGVDGVITAAVVLCAAASLRTGTLSTVKVTPYSSTLVQHELLRVYDCLWLHAGSDANPRFPTTLEAGCLSPQGAPGAAAYGTGYTIAYHQGPGGFTLVTMDAGHRDPESFYLDETGALRRSVGAPATSASQIWNAEGCRLLSTLARELDAFRAKHPAIGYPARIIVHDWPPDTTDDGVFRTSQFSHRDTVTVRTDGATEIRTAFGRLVVYQRSRGGYTLSVTQTDPSRGASDSSLISDALLDLLRSYFRDSDGVIHVTGALRPATPSDPAINPKDCTQIG